VSNQFRGSTIQYQCQVPVKRPAVVVGIKNGSELVTSFSLPKGKQIQFAGKAPLGPAVKWLQQSVPRTDYVNYYADVVAGTGAAVKPGKQVKILLTAYADDRFDRPLHGVAKGQPLQFTVGKGELGPGHDGAVGGKRWLKIRQEVAGTINDILGGVHPENQIVVEIELVATQ
jgi:hypothetical protein